MRKRREWTVFFPTKYGMIEQTLLFPEVPKKETSWEKDEGERVRSFKTSAVVSGLVRGSKQEYLV